MYKYNLKNLPYTVNIITNDNTVTNSPPISVTAHNGIDLKNPHFSIAVIIDWGSVVPVADDIPAVLIIVEIIPWTISNIDNKGV